MWSLGLRVDGMLRVVPVPVLELGLGRVERRVVVSSL
jgi:hypothetical protein